VKMRRKQDALAAIAGLNRWTNGEYGTCLEVRLAVSKLQRERRQKHLFQPVCRSHNGGPNGCNIFVFHIPTDWSEYHLRQYFGSYGYLVSVTVIRDKSTSATRGYGFVSYDNPFSAQAAVLHMNGFLIGGKRLKVQIKRGEYAPTVMVGGG
jgi:RNA recognition motif-containing protein